MTPEAWQHYVQDLALKGISLHEVTQEFGSPLIVLNESEMVDRILKLQNWSNQLSSVTPPPKCLGLASIRQEKHSRLPGLFTSITAFPRQATLSVLKKFSVGLLLTSESEVRRCSHAGIDLSRCIFSTPFRSSPQVYSCFEQGVGFAEIESARECQELMHYFEEMSLRQSKVSGSKNGTQNTTSQRSHEEKRLGLCFHIELGSLRTQSSQTSKTSLLQNPNPSGADAELQIEDEFHHLSALCRDSQFFTLAGISLTWNSFEEFDLDALRKSLNFVRTLAFDRNSQNATPLFLLVGPRQDLDTHCEAFAEQMHNLHQAINEVLTQTPIDVKFCCGQGVFGFSGHLIAKVLRTKLIEFPRPTALAPTTKEIFLDLSVQNHIIQKKQINDKNRNPVYLIGSSPAVAEQNSPRRKAMASKSLSCENMFRLYARDAHSGSPVLLFELCSAETIEAGDSLFIPGSCARTTLRIFQSTRASQPAEIMFTADGDTHVIRTHICESHDLGCEP